MHEHRRIRRRVLPIAAGLIAVALVAATAAMALSSDSPTGEPAIDRVIADYDPPPGPPGAPRPDVEPVPGSAGPTLRLRPRPGRRAVAKPHVTREGIVCVAIAKQYGRTHPGGSFSCANQRIIRKALRRSPVSLNSGGGLDRKTLISMGFARSGVVAARILGPGRVYLSKPWRPAGTDLPKLRIAIALSPLDLDAPPQSVIHPDLEVTLDDGTVVAVPSPYRTNGSGEPSSVNSLTP